MRSRILVTLILALLPIRSSLCRGDDESATQWGPFTGTVVDASTGQPIPGALFAVVWYEGSEMFIPMPGHGDRFFDARVAVADERGRFEIPRRHRAFFAPRPDVGCASPGYKDQIVRPQGGPTTVQLRPLTQEEKRKRHQNGWPVNNLALIPTEKWNDFERSINQRRAEMGLPAICFGGNFLCEWTIADSWFTDRFYPEAYGKLGGPTGLRKHKVNNTRVFPVQPSASSMRSSASTRPKSDSWPKQHSRRCERVCRALSNWCMRTTMRLRSVLVRQIEHRT